MDAYINQDLDAIKLVLEKDGGRSINQHTDSHKYYTYPVMIAAEHNNLPMLKLLIEYCKEKRIKCDLNVFNTKTRHATALLTSIINGYDECAEYLLTNGAWVDAYDYDDNDFFNNLDFYEDQYMNGEIEGPRKHTTIYYACHNKNKEIVELLLDRGASYGYISKYDGEEAQEVWNFLKPILIERDMNFDPEETEPFFF